VDVSGSRLVAGERCYVQHYGVEEKEQRVGMEEVEWAGMQEEC